MDSKAPPGWNDPPPLQFDPTKTFNTTKTKLNKRVGLSFQGTTPQQSPAKSSQILPAAVPPLPPAIFNPLEPPKSTENTANFSDFIKTIKETTENLKPDEKIKYQEHLLTVLENRWEKQELDDSLVEKLCSIGKAIEEKDPKVTAIYQSIATQCSENWVKFLKELVFKVSKSEEDV